MNKTILRLVDEYEEEGDFSYTPFTDEMKTTAEESLGLTIPTQYLDFLKTFGQGGICGVEILGVSAEDTLDFVEETQDYREDGLPDGLIVIENCDEWVCCIDCATGKVVSWAYDEEAPRLDFRSFNAFVIDRFKEAAEDF